MDSSFHNSFTELEYLLLGLVSAVPSFLIPMLFVGKIDADLVVAQVEFFKLLVCPVIGMT
ncbi:hypothetical protein ACB094_04G024000 [Castanea mollissima]